MLRNFAWLLGSASVIAPAAMPIMAHAQENAQVQADQQGFGDIVVTATRREASLQKVPLSVSAVSADTLTSRNILAITDIATGQVPGVVFQAFGGTVSSAEISIRGVATNDPDQATRELPVPIYIDGVYLGRGQGSGLQLIDPERVEVLRGPQGTLFGRNAEGGAVQYIARKPTGEFGLDLTGSIGNYDFRRFRGTMNLPELYGFKILIAGLMSDQDGFTRNPRGNLGFGAVDGIRRQRRDFSERQNDGWRVAVRYDKIENLVLDYSYDWSRSEDTQAYLTYTGPQIPGAEAPSDSLPREAPLPFYHAPFITKASGHSFTAAWTVSDNVTLKSISSYRKVSKVGYGNLGTTQNLAGAPFFNLDPLDPDQAIYYIADQDLRQKQYSQEVQFLGSWDRLDLTAGAVYYAERVTQIAHPSFFSGPGLTFIGLPDFLPGPRTAHRVRTNSLGLYAQATYTPPILDDKLELTAGLRYADDTKNAVRYLDINPSTGAEVASNERVRIAEKRVDPAFTIKYNFSPLANVYLRYAQAYRAGGASIRSVNFLPYDSEVTKAFELGAKLQTPDRRLLVNAALYQNKVHNPQFDVGEDPNLSQQTITINGPIVRTVRGVELEASYRPPIDGLSLSVNYAYMHVKQPPFINPNNPAAGLVNAQILFAPKHSGSVNVDYRVPAGFADFVLHADYSHATKIYNGGEINPVGTVSPTDPVIVRQLNARVSLEKLDIGAGNVSLSFWVKNLLNRDDLVYAFRLPGDDVHSFNYYVDPRTYGVDIRYQF